MKKSLQFVTFLVFHLTLSRAWQLDRRQDTSTGLPTASPFLIFTGTSQFVTCSAASISWAYSGPSSLLSLSITTIGVDQSASTPTQSGSSSSTGPSHTYTNGDSITARAIPSFLAGQANDAARTVLQLITDQVNPTEHEYTWDAVAVPEGWYTIYASMDDYPDFSAQVYNDIYVFNGSDVSCLSVGGASSSSSSFTPTSTSSSATPSTSNTAVSVGASVNKGAIAGGVVGGLAVLAAILAAYMFFVCCPARRRRAVSSAAGSVGSRGMLGKWGALGSFESTHSNSHKKKAKVYNNKGSPVLGTTGSHAQRARHHSQADSLGPIMSMGSTMEDYTPYVEEKNSSHGHGMVGMIPVGYNPPRPGVMRQSISSGSSEMYAINYAGPHSAMQTFPESPRSSAMEVDISPPSRRVSVGIDGAETTNVESKRQSRRTPRKPVPSYTPDSIESFGVPSNSTTPASQYQTPSQLDGSPTGSVEAVHQLIHKGSFGDGRPVHVLMPDMPIPTQT